MVLRSGWLGDCGFSAVSALAMLADDARSALGAVFQGQRAMLAHVVKASMPTAHVFDVAGDRGFPLDALEHPIGVARERIDAGRVGLHIGDRRQHFEQPDRHRGARACVLPDHVEHQIDETVVRKNRHHEDHAPAAQANAGRQAAPAQAGQSGAKPVEHTPIAASGLFTAGDNARTATSTSSRTGYSRSSALWRSAASARGGLHRSIGPDGGRLHERHDRAGKHVVAWPHQQPHGRTPFGCPIGQVVGVDVVQVATRRAADGRQRRANASAPAGSTAPLCC